MWRRSGSFWVSSLALLLLLISGCSADEELLYDPPPASITIQPPFSSQYDQAPSVSRDAAVLAWVRRDTGGQQSSWILRWDRVREQVDTLLTYRGSVDSIDLSEDGNRVVALTQLGSDVDLYVWRDGRAALRPVPPGYNEFATPRWLDEIRILFGASGPEGGGVYQWNLATDQIDPVAVRFYDPIQAWSGSSPGIDRSGTQICMEARVDRTIPQATVREINDASTLLFAVGGSAPHFWNLLPDEPDGLLYLDRESALRGVRPMTGDRYFILAGVYEFDVSSDGQWVFARASIPAFGLVLVLRDLRDLR